MGLGQMPVEVTGLFGLDSIAVDTEDTKGSLGVGGWGLDVLITIRYVL